MLLQLLLRVLRRITTKLIIRALLICIQYHVIVWISKMTKCSIWPNCTSSLLESWIRLQWCRDLWEFCWWWSRLFQFTEVTSAMMSKPTTCWRRLTNRHYWGHPRPAEGQRLYQIFCDDIFTAAFWCVLSGLWRTHCSGLIWQKVAEQLTRIVQSGW